MEITINKNYKKVHTNMDIILIEITSEIHSFEISWNFDYTKVYPMEMIK